MHQCKCSQPRVTLALSAATASTMVKLCFSSLQVFTATFWLPLNTSVWFDRSSKRKVVSGMVQVVSRQSLCQNCYHMCSDQVVSPQFLVPSTGSFEVSKRHWGPEAPQEARGLGAAQAPSGVQGSTPLGVKGAKPPEAKRIGGFRTS